MILLPGCQCCCPCGPSTLPWTAQNNVVLTIYFSGAGSYNVCQNQGDTLTLNNLGLCEYYSDYLVSVFDQQCVVKIFYLNKNGPCFRINGWSTDCPNTITAITVGEPC